MKKSLSALYIASLTLIFANQAFAVDEAYSEIINNKGRKVGTVSLKQGTEGIVMRIKVRGLKPGAHGMQFHEVGDCADTDKFEKSGAEVSSQDKSHGFFNPDGPHEANLPNLIVAADGSAHVELYADMVSLSGQGWKPQLLDEDGSAIIIYEKEDDHYSHPNGNAGKKVACGAINSKELDHKKDEEEGE